MDRDSVDRWLRNEAENIDKEIEKVEIKIKKIIRKEDMNSLDKINQFQIKRRELRAVQVKLYEMMGRIDEIEEEWFLFKIEKVSTDKHGGCYNCKDSKWNDEIQNIEYKDKEVNQFVIGNTVIRLCDKCLKELKESIKL